MRGRWLEVAVGFIVFLVVLGGGEFALQLAGEREAAERRLATMAAATSFGTALSHELGSVLYLSSGLHAYVVTHNHELDALDVERMLSFLYGSARHVRNFGIAVGHRMTYVYPPEGNEKTIGMNYRDLKDHWPAVSRTIETGQRMLIGPVALVQGGQGFVYRVPVYIEGKYWGMLSTVVDPASLFASAMRTAGRGPFAFAIRDAAESKVFFGRAGLFEEADATTVDLDVPGGKWTIAARPIGVGPASEYLTWLRVLVALFAITLGWVVYQTFGQRRRFGQMALYDALTGLPNRRLIEDRFERAAVRRKRDPTVAVAMVFLDLDGFKAINDRLGHKAGDAVLRGVASRLGDTLRDSDSVGRWGGDEFVVMLEGAVEGGVAELIARLRHAVEIPVHYEEQDLRVGASIGLARMPEDGESIAELMRLADTRMYENKQERKAAR